MHVTYIVVKGPTYHVLVSCLALSRLAIPESIVQFGGNKRDERDVEGLSLITCSRSQPSIYNVILNVQLPGMYVMRRADCRPRRERQDTISMFAKRRTRRDSRLERRDEVDLREDVTNEGNKGENFCGFCQFSEPCVFDIAVGESDSFNDSFNKPIFT